VRKWAETFAQLSQDDQVQLARKWERRLQRIGGTLPVRGTETLAEYIAQVRELVTGPVGVTQDRQVVEAAQIIVEVAMLFDRLGPVAQALGLSQTYAELEALTERFVDELAAVSAEGSG